MGPIFSQHIFKVLNKLFENLFSDVLCTFCLFVFFPLVHTILFCVIVIGSYFPTKIKYCSAYLCPVYLYVQCTKVFAVYIIQ